MRAEDMPGPDDDRQMMGVPEDAGIEEIQAAFRRLANEFNPEVCKDPHERERFGALEAAYDRLLVAARHRGNRAVPPEEIARAAINGTCAGAPTSGRRWKRHLAKRRKVGVAVFIVVLSFLGYYWATGDRDAAEKSGVDTTSVQHGEDSQGSDEHCEEPGSPCLQLLTLVAVLILFVGVPVLFVVFMRHGFRGILGS
jgi:hypothetical protein